MARIADPLRALADETDWYRWDCGRLVRKMRAVADEIDAEHERRMRKQSYDLRKAFCRYLGGIINDYRHGIKRKRLRK
jgi:hypothetical protein